MQQVTSPQLVGPEDCLNIVFPLESSRPSKRTFAKWMANGFFAHHKIGRRVFLDPDEVRRALDRRFKVHAVPAQ